MLEARNNLMAVSRMQRPYALLHEEAEGESELLLEVHVPMDADGTQL